MSDLPSINHSDVIITPRNLTADLSPIIKAFQPVALSDLIGTQVELPSGKKVFFQEPPFYREILKERPLSIAGGEYFHYVVHHFDDALLTEHYLTVSFVGMNYTEANVLELRKFLQTYNVMVLLKDQDVPNEMLGPGIRVGRLLTYREYVVSVYAQFRRIVSDDELFFHRDGDLPSIKSTLSTKLEQMLPQARVEGRQLEFRYGEPDGVQLQSEYGRNLWIWIPASDALRMGLLHRPLRTPEGKPVETFFGGEYDPDELTQSVLLQEGWSELRAEDLEVEDPSSGMLYGKLPFEITERLRELMGVIRWLMEQRLEYDRPEHMDYYRFLLGMGHTLFERDQSEYYYEHVFNRKSGRSRLRLNLTWGMLQGLCVEIKRNMLDIIHECAITMRDLATALDMAGAHPEAAKRIIEDWHDMLNLQADLAGLAAGKPMGASVSVYRNQLVELHRFYHDRLSKHRFMGQLFLYSHKYFAPYKAFNAKIVKVIDVVMDNRAMYYRNGRKNENREAVIYTDRSILNPGLRFTTWFSHTRFGLWLAGLSKTFSNKD